MNEKIDYLREKFNNEVDRIKKLRELVGEICLSNRTFQNCYLILKSYRESL